MLHAKLTVFERRKRRFFKAEIVSTRRANGTRCEDDALIRCHDFSTSCDGAYTPIDRERLPGDVLACVGCEQQRDAL